MEVCPVLLTTPGLYLVRPNNSRSMELAPFVLADPESITDRLYRRRFNFSRQRMTTRKKIYDDIGSRSAPPALVDFQDQPGNYAVHLEDIL